MKLPVTPSVRSTIEFNISYRQSSMEYKYPIMGIYTEYPKINIGKRCSYVQFGQLRNENLHPVLKVGQYRTTRCELSGADTVNCTGRVNIQDYIPRNFYLTFTFSCYLQPVYSLQGLIYNISFTRQTNHTNPYTDHSVFPVTDSTMRHLFLI